MVGGKAMLSTKAGSGQLVSLTMSVTVLMLHTRAHFLENALI